MHVIAFLPIQNDSLSAATTIRLIQPNGTFCLPEPYIGQVCKVAFQSREDCLQNGFNNGQIYIPASSIRQEVLELQAQHFIERFQFLNPVPECMEQVIPFICLYTFGGLCSDSSKLYRLSSEECFAITDNVCAREFESARQLVHSDQLPQCQLLPNTSIECNGKLEQWSFKPNDISWDVKSPRLTSDPTMLLHLETFIRFLGNCTVMCIDNIDIAS